MSGMDDMEASPPCVMRPVVEEERSLTHMQLFMSEKYRQMVSMHLSFILNLNEHKLADILEAKTGNPESKKNIILELFPMLKKNSKIPPIFGLPVSFDAVAIMNILINFLHQQENVSCEGLFRRPGNILRIRELKEQINAEGLAFCKVDKNIYSACDVACLLKEYLRELPEPLVTERHIEAHRQVSELGSHATKAEDKARYFLKKVSALQLLIQLVPLPVAQMIRELLFLLQRVANAPASKMTPKTLATIFAPIFFVRRKASGEEMAEIVKKTQGSLEFMIANAEQMYKIPRGLYVDVQKFWIDLANETQTFSQSRNSSQDALSICIQNVPMRTTVCFIDREQSAENTTEKELANLMAFVQSMPDTPANRKRKQKFQKYSGTPLSATEEPKQRSSSVGASLKKRLTTSLFGRSKSKDCSKNTETVSLELPETLGFKESSNPQVTIVHYAPLVQPFYERLDCLPVQRANTIPAMSDLLQTPPPTAGKGRMSLKDKHRKRNSSENSRNNRHCTPPKTTRRHSSSQQFRSPSPYSPPVTRNKRGKNFSEQTNGRSRSSSSRALSKKSDRTVQPTNVMLQAADSFEATDESLELTDTSISFSGSEIEFSTSEPETEISVAGPSNPGSSTSSLENENEITYMVYEKAKAKQSTPTPNLRVLPRSCKAPSTPVNTRTLLQLPMNHTLETSI